MRVQSFTHPEASKAGKRRVKCAVVDGAKLFYDFFLLGRKLHEKITHLFLLYTNSSLQDLLLWHDHYTHTGIQNHTTLTQLPAAELKLLTLSSKCNLKAESLVVCGCYSLSLHIPMAWHLWKRQAWHDRRLFFVIVHSFRNEQRSCDDLFMARLNLVKNPNSNKLQSEVRNHKNESHH